MYFDVIDSLSLAGKPGVPNDDRAGARESLGWVIDGATDLGPPGLVGRQGGAAWLASEADAALYAAADAPLESLMRALFEQLAEAFAAARTRPPHARWEQPMAAVAVVRLAEAEIECAWLGDCVVLLRSGGDVGRLCPRPRIKDAEAQRAASLAHHGLGNVGSIDGPVLEALRASRERASAVLGVEPEAHSLIQTARTRCSAGDELLLMSDGFAALVDSYGVHDDVGLFAAVESSGLVPLAAQLRAIEAEDAACVRYPRFKTSDDATALRLRIG